MLFAVTFVIYGFISNATTQSIAMENYKMITESYCIIFMKTIVPFSKLSDNQTNNLMLGSLTTSTKQITQENQVIFPNDKQSSVTTNEIFTTHEFHIHLKTLLPGNLYLNMNNITVLPH